MPPIIIYIKKAYWQCEFIKLIKHDNNYLIRKVNIVINLPGNCYERPINYIVNYASDSPLCFI